MKAGSHALISTATTCYVEATFSTSEALTTPPLLTKEKNIHNPLLYKDGRKIKPNFHYINCKNYG